MQKERRAHKQHSDSEFANRRRHRVEPFSVPECSKLTVATRTVKDLMTGNWAPLYFAFVRLTGGFSAAMFHASPSADLTGCELAFFSRT